MSILNITTIAPLVHPLDQMNWNDIIWTPNQADILKNQGFDMSEMKIMPFVLGTNKAVVSPNENNGQARWPGNTGNEIHKMHFVKNILFSQTDRLFFKLVIYS